MKELDIETLIDESSHIILMLILICNSLLDCMERLIVVVELYNKYFGSSFVNSSQKTT